MIYVVNERLSILTATNLSGAADGDRLTTPLVPGLEVPLAAIFAD